MYRIHYNMKKTITYIIIFLGIIVIVFQLHIYYIKKNKNVTVSNNTQLSDISTFSSEKVPNYIYENMIGKSIPFEYKNSININTLSYLKISYIGFDNRPHIGEIIVNSELANDILNIFKELYELKYPIEKIKLIDEYDGNDELSMSDNNTSCFCYRTISSTSKLSNHANGTAIDINPLYNPFVSNNTISPVSATLYANRNIDCKYQIKKNDVLYQIFTNHGWSWGGDWSKSKDYQHFEKKTY